MIEIIASLLTLLCVWLAGRQSLLNWPVGIVAVCCFGWVFWQAKLYAAAALQVVFLVQSAWGWWTWGRQQDVVKCVDRAELPFWVGQTLLAAVPLWLILTAARAAAPLMDALTFCLSLLATYLLTYRYIETWAVWGVTNVLYAGLFLSQGLYAAAALSLTLVGINRIAYLSWKASLKPSAA